MNSVDNSDNRPNNPAALERPPVVIGKSSVIRDLLAGLALAGVLVGFVVIYFIWRGASREAMRNRDLPITVSRAAPIVAAIKQYQKERGKPPPSLQALVPRYLPKLPEPGPIAERGWRYKTDEQPDAGGWSLQVDVRNEYSPNIIGFGDVFVYRPSGEYPVSGYGGSFVKYGKWGYYIE